jgi:hypothetical protein
MKKLKFSYGNGVVRDVTVSNREGGRGGLGCEKHSLKIKQADL